MDDRSPSPALLEGEQSKAPPRGRKRALTALVLCAGAIAGALYGWHWWTVGRFLESTDDAYLQADNVAMGAAVAGRVTEVPVLENQRVKAGDLLARIEDGIYRAAVDEASATVAAAEADEADLAAQEAWQQTAIAQATAELEAAEAALHFAQQEEARYHTLVSSGASTAQRVDQAESELSQRTAAVSRARSALDGARRQLEVLHAQRAKNSAVIAVDRARLDRARIDLDHTAVLAPIDGVVGDKSVRVGQYVQPGTRLMTVVPVQDTYVVANFKETQLERMTPGQRVAIEVDALPGERFAGRVASLAPGSGSQFSLLPPENATGNFTKIVQRVPTKIRFDQPDPRLRPGLSVTATVDTLSPAGAR